MNILFYGAGVIGGIYAAKLSLSGHNITVLARGKRLNQLNDGIILKNAVSGDVIKAKITLISELIPEDKYDLIVVAMKNEQINVVLPILAKNMSEKILVMVNTALGYSQWTESLGENRLLAGFPAAGGYIDADGVVNFFVMDGFYRFLQKTTVGEVTKTKQDAAQKIVRMLSDAGFPSEYCADMDAWQKTHVAIISPIANALYKHNGDCKLLAKSKDDIRLLVKAIREGFSVIESLGYSVTPTSLSTLFNLPMPILVAYWQITFRTKFAEISIAPHANNARIELYNLANEFKTLAIKSEQTTLAIDSLYEFASIN